MPQSQEERNQPQNSFLASPIMQTPLFAIVAEMNGTLLETMATAQKEWANFVDRRIKEDVPVFAPADAVPLAGRHAPGVLLLFRNGF